MDYFKKMENKRKVIIWSAEIMNLLNDKPVGGIAVQMYFWARAFVENGWDVYSFSDNDKDSIREGIVFKSTKTIKYINILMEWWRSLKYIISVRPELVIFRGAHRLLLPLSIFTKLSGVKLVYFSASDVNFEPGRELVGSEFNRALYQHSISRISYFVTQNKYQHDTLLHNYGKESLIMFNIWGRLPSLSKQNSKKYSAVWIANFRSLKRAEWALMAAEKQPSYSFALAGASSDKDYYHAIKLRADGLPNVSFLGGVSFPVSNELVANSKVLLCTSTFEGFPNTFLQAWANGIPVISTVDPSGIISENNLGVVVSTVDELVTALQRVLEDEEYYKILCASVSIYFHSAHATDMGYQRLMKYLKYE